MLTSPTMPTPVWPTPAVINQKNQEFWDFLIPFHECAWKIMAYANCDGSSFTVEKYNEALSLAGSAGRFARKQIAIKGGKATKQDVLQALIIRIVKVRPNITVMELYQRLEEEKNLGIIEDMDTDDGKIHFNNYGSSKSAKINGLKDRIYRAKKALAQTS